MLLSTKLKPPTISPFIVPRSRLFSILDRAITGNVTLVTAPAGYGKTTLVAGWSAQRPEPSPAVTWLLLDEYDDEPVRFMRYFIAALQQIMPDVGMTIQEMLQSNHMAPLPQSMEEMLTTLINEITVVAERDATQNPEPLLLILDDFHYITDQQLVNGIRFWIEHAPTTVHTILTSRDASMLPVPRWKVRRQCVEVTTAELRFRPEEAGSFVRNLLRLDLTDDELLRLTKRTEGWIAGLQLAAMSLQSADDPKQLLRNFTGSDRHVTDYLVEEVLEKQPTAIHDFLLQTSVLKRLSAELCDAVVERTDSFQLLEQLEKRNLFLVPLDNQRRWYRYHPLFAEALQARLPFVQNMPTADLHRRAYQWLAAHEEPDEAIEHALAAQLYPEATQLIFEQCQVIVWQQGRPRVFLRWCDQIPEETLFTMPRLVLAIGWSLLLLGQIDRLTPLTQTMRERWSANDFAFADGSQIRNEVALLEAEIAVHRGDIPQVMQILGGLDARGTTLHPATQATAHQLYGYAHRLEGNLAQAKEFLWSAAQLTEQTDQTSLWLFSHFDLAETYVMAGEFTEAHATYAKVLRRYPADRYPNYLSLAYIYNRFARLLYLQSRLVAAADYVQRSLAISNQTKWLKRYGLMMLAEIHYIQGNWSSVTKLIERIRTMQGATESSNTRLYFETCIARLYLLHGDLTEVAGWAATYRQSIERIPRYQLHTADVTFARYQVAVDPKAAIGILYDLRQTAQKELWHESLIEIYILLALAHQAVAEPSEAVEMLECAMVLTDPEQIMTPFLVEGAPMASLLRQALIHHNHRRSFIGQLQAAFLPVDDEGTITAAQSLVEPLTNRELEILRMIADGLTNPEIAEQLIVATGTVAKHTNNIFGKLTVRNRTEAVQRAQALGLI